MARPIARRGNLPAEATSFIGRRRELAAGRRRLAAARLVSLVGPGGVGKTRLALRLATDLGRGFPDGAWLVELAAIQDPALVDNAVLAALDLRAQDATAPRALLRSYLRDKDLLLVLDNCEHLLGAAAQLAAAVLGTAPGVRVLATSREPLAVAGEQVVPVAPLELPAADGDEPLARLSQNEAVMLFAERAAAATGAFELTAANRAAVVELCRRLDGLPLALELAAVRTRVLAVEQIRDRLVDRFALLTGGGRAALPRQQTLRTAIDWSHDLLADDERALLRRCGVFAGRCTLEDVEAVGMPDGAPVSRTLDLLSSLVDKSLLLKEDAGAVAHYRLHETMRDYARLKLREAGEEEAVERRYADYYLSRCRQAAPEARYRLPEWLGWMELEIDNVRSVLRRCLAQGDWQRGLALAGAVGWYWITRATAEGVRWLEALVAAAGGAPEALAPASFLRGFLALLQADPTAAGPALLRAAAAARQVGQRPMLAQASALAAIAAQMAGDRAAAGVLLGEAQAVAAGLADYPATITVLQARVLHALFTGDLDAAGTASADGARRSREAGDLYSLEMMLLNQGGVTLRAGALAASRRQCAEALRIARRLDDRVAQNVLLDFLGCHAARSGRARLAARLFGAAETVRAGAGANVIPIVAPLLTEAEEAAIAALGPARYAAEVEAGKRMGRAAAIGLALGEPAQVDATASDEDGAGVLGKREAEVARLVADGLSNKEIGARLFISERTVESHVRGIMNKLGVNARAQIAGWMASSQR